MSKIILEGDKAVGVDHTGLPVVRHYIVSEESLHVVVLVSKRVILSARAI